MHADEQDLAKLRFVLLRAVQSVLSNDPLLAGYLDQLCTPDSEVSFEAVVAFEESPFQRELAREPKELSQIGTEVRSKLEKQAPFVAATAIKARWMAQKVVDLRTSVIAVFKPRKTKVTVVKPIFNPGIKQPLTYDELLTDRDRNWLKRKLCIDPD